MHEPVTPIGQVTAYAAPRGTPPGYLECNGQEVSRTLFADLFDVCGERWGAGDGESTFRVPDLSDSPIRWIVFTGRTR